MKKLLMFIMLLGLIGCSSQGGSGQPDSDSLLDSAILDSDSTNHGGAEDTSVIDTSVVDTSVVDTSVVDTSVIDTSVIDTSVVDTSIIDTSVIDTSVVDTSVGDTSVVDTGVVAQDTDTALPLDTSDTATMVDTDTVNSVDTDTTSGSGQVSNQMMTLVLNPTGDYPLVFHTMSVNVTEDDNGYLVQGAMLLETPLGNLPIAGVDARFNYVADSSLGLMELLGTAQMPTPNMGILSGAVQDAAPTVNLGYALGTTLNDEAGLNLETPVQDDRYYLFFDYSQGFDLGLGPVSLNTPGGQDATMLFDPEDPFWFMRGSLAGLSEVMGIEDVAIGISNLGLIPFSAQTTWGLSSDVVTDFDGQLYLAGTVGLAKLPLAIEGETVIDIDPQGSGRTLANASGLQLGANGTLNLTTDFLKVFSFTMELGTASVGATLDGDTQNAYLSGTVAPDTSFVPQAIPIRHQGELDAAGYISSELADSYIKAEGQFGIDGTRLSEMVGFNVNDLLGINGALDISSNGFELAGTVGAGLALTSELSFGAGATVTAHFADDPADWFIEVSGTADVLGIDLFDAVARIDASGIALSGKIDTGISNVAMSGTVGKNGVALTGQAGVSISVDGFNTVTEWIVDGAVCGYEYVKDGGLCGYELVKDGVKCGYEVVTSGALCGYNLITDGAKCGYEVVTNGALCGYNVVTDGAKCGYDTITNAAICGTKTIGCWLNPFKWGSCSVAKECKVAKSCTDFSSPKSCTDLTKPKSCTNYSSPKSCTDLTKPKTCTDFSAPKTCMDLTKPKGCDHQVDVPDFHFGELNGDILLGINTGSGLTGEINGEYCTASDSCTTIIGGRLKVGNPMEACFDAPAGLGEFCAPF